MGTVLHLVPVPPSVSKDTVRRLELWLDQAKRGDLVGIAGVMIHRGNRWTADAAGEAMRMPTFTMGMLQRLARRLEDIEDPGAA